MKNTHAQQMQKLSYKSRIKGKSKEEITKMFKEMSEKARIKADSQKTHIKPSENRA